MSWSTAVGLSGISALGISLVVAFLILVKRCYELGQDAVTAQQNEAAERTARGEAEEQRNTALAGEAKALSERDVTRDALTAERFAHAETLKELQTLREKEIDNADAEDLIKIGGDILGNRS